MKTSASIELVMQFATYEALPGKFREAELGRMVYETVELAGLSVVEIATAAVRIGSFCST